MKPWSIFGQEIVEDFLEACDDNLSPAVNIGKHLVSRIESLEGELAKARAATVQWVTYDGTPETLPKISLGAVIINVRRKYTGYIPLFIYRVAICVNNNWDSAHALPLPVEIGDRWAYLPESPEVME